MTVLLEQPMVGWLVGRVRQIIDAGFGDELAGIWPDDLPTLKTGGHSEPQLEQIAQMCSKVEANHRMLFPATDPRADTVTIPEGSTVAPTVLHQVAGELAVLDERRADIVEELSSRAFESGHSISLRAMPSARRVEIIKALIHLSGCSTMNELLDHLCAVTGAGDNDELGVVVGCLTTNHAKQLQLATINQREKADQP